MLNKKICIKFYPNLIKTSKHKSYYFKIIFIKLILLTLIQIHTKYILYYGLINYIYK